MTVIDREIPERGDTSRDGDTSIIQKSVGAEADAPRNFQGQGAKVEAVIGDVLEGAAQITEAMLGAAAVVTERLTDFAAESLAGLLGGASAPAPWPFPQASPPQLVQARPADNGDSRDDGKAAALQAEDDRIKRRSQYLQDFDQEIPDELQQDAEIDRSHGRGRSR